MSSIRITAFNAQDKFGICWPDANRDLQQLPYSGDVIVIPEAYPDDNQLNGMVQVIHEEDKREAFHVPYNDYDNRKDRHNLVVYVNAELLGLVEAVRLVGRTALRASLNNGVDVFGVHLDDRQEEMRLKQTHALLELRDPTRRTVIAGDLNSIHSGAWRASILRRAARCINILPVGEPGTKHSKVARFGSLATRLAMMAEGGPLTTLEREGFEDADPRHQGTKGGFQLDHIMVPKGMRVSDFTVIPMRRSDHSAISAQLVVEPIVQ